MITFTVGSCLLLESVEEHGDGIGDLSIRPHFCSSDVQHKAMLIFPISTENEFCI